jgi:integrase
LPKRSANGEGSIFKPSCGDRWVASLTVGWDPEGRRRRIRHSAKTRREVADWLAARLAERQKGLLVEPGRQSVASFLSGWLEDWVAVSVGPRTFETYAGICRNHVIPAIGKVLLAKLTPQHLQRLYRQKLDAGHSRTAQLCHAVLYRALGHAVKWGLLARNPAAAVDRPRHRSREMKSLTPEEARRFLDAAKGNRLAALYVLAISCGLRQGELLGLGWSSIDLVEGTLQVRRSLAWVDGGFQFLEPKTAKSRRTVVLPAIALSALKKHKAAQAAERLVLGEAWADAELVFTTRIGAPLGRSVLNHHGFKPLLTKAGLPDMRFHDLRHTAASLLLAAGENMKVVQELLGHARFSTTADTYTHTLPGQHRQAAETMDSLLKPRGSRVAHKAP